jgi:hypothetical protein
MVTRKIIVPMSDGTLVEISDISPVFLDVVRLYFKHDSVDDVKDREIVEYIIEATRKALDKHPNEEI